MVGVVTAGSIMEAWHRIKGDVRVTPVFRAFPLTENLPQPCDLYFKLELHQLTGSFKTRGVMNKIFCAHPDLLKNGLFTASGGNHGRAVAYAGWKRKLKSTIVLPITTPQNKIDLIEQWGAQIIIAGVNLDEANEIAIEESAKANALFIHPYADPEVIQGQGTLAVELFDQLPDVDTVIMAVGGGGLISGVGTYLKSIKPGIRIIGVEPIGCPTLHDSLKAGKIVSVADITTKVGTLAIRQTSELNFNLAQACVDEMVLMSDEDMLAASKRIWRDFGVAGELSGVASYAGLLSGQIQVQPHEKVCVLICGLGTDGCTPS
jgi:threonine dehydratase